MRVGAQMGQPENIAGPAVCAAGDVVGSPATPHRRVIAVPSGEMTPSRPLSAGRRAGPPQSGAVGVDRPDVRSAGSPGPGGCGRGSASRRATSRGRRQALIRYGVTRRRAVPWALITKTACASAGLAVALWRTETICLPSGDHWGSTSTAAHVAGWETLRMREPPIRMRWMPEGSISSLRMWPNARLNAMRAVGARSPGRSCRCTSAGGARNRRRRAAGRCRPC